MNVKIWNPNATDAFVRDGDLHGRIGFLGGVEIGQESRLVPTRREVDGDCDLLSHVVHIVDLEVPKINVHRSRRLVGQPHLEVIVGQTDAIVQ